jgi:hypothetical protein
MPSLSSEISSCARTQIMHTTLLFRSVIVAGLSAFATCAYAQSPHSELGPPGWPSKQDGALTQFDAPTGRERVTVRAITSIDDPLEAARQLVTGVGGQSADCAMEPAQPLAVCDSTIAASGFDLLIRTYVGESDEGLTSLMHMGASGTAGLQQRMNASGERINAVLSAGSSPSAPTPRAEPTPIGAGSSGSEKLETVQFRLGYSYGVGGAVYPKYEPLYFFKNGQSCLCADLAPGDVDLQVLARSRPKDIGRWRKAGRNYEITESDGDTKEIKTSVGPPATLPGGRLQGRYGSISGGGNTAFGGSTTVIASKDYDFRSDGTFYQESFGGGGNRTVTAGSQRNQVGRWTLSGATLTLEYPSGERVRTSVYWDSKGDLVGGVPDAIWIGGRGYTLED